MSTKLILDSTGNNYVYCLAPEGSDGVLNPNHYMQYVWHREDGPARVSQWGAQWWDHGVMHKYDGPAMIHYGDDNNIAAQYWLINGHDVEENDYLTWLENNGMYIENLSDTDKILIDMKWPR